MRPGSLSSFLVSYYCGAACSISFLLAFASKLFLRATHDDSQSTMPVIFLTAIFKYFSSLLSSNFLLLILICDLHSSLLSIKIFFFSRVKNESLQCTNFFFHLAFDSLNPRLNLKLLLWRVWWATWAEHNVSWLEEANFFRESLSRYVLGAVLEVAGLGICFKNNYLTSWRRNQHRIFQRPRLFHGGGGRR